MKPTDELRNASHLRRVDNLADEDPAAGKQSPAAGPDGPAASGDARPGAPAGPEVARSRPDRGWNFGRDDFRENGLYLLFPDGRRITLTRERIESFAHLFEANLEQIPPAIRTAVAFQACPVCPERENSRFCHALPATLAYFEDLQGFKSFDQVAAVYKGPGQGLVFVPETTLQEALQFVVILSLLYYCELGKRYWRYLLGIHPLMGPEEMITRIHLNVFWDCKGDQRKVNEVLRLFSDEITCTCRCQVNRLRLICKDETLVNAFVNTQAQIERLAAAKGAVVEQAIDAFLKDGWANTARVGDER